MGSKWIVCLVMRNFKLLLERLALFFVWFDFPTRSRLGLIPPLYQLASSNAGLSRHSWLSQFVCTRNQRQRQKCDCLSSGVFVASNLCRSSFVVCLIFEWKLPHCN